MIFGLCLLLSTASVYDFNVAKVGHGPDVILIPGLANGPSEWESTVKHLSDHYTCHLITLPGFAGIKSIKAPILSTVRDQIESYVQTKNLDHPILIGHSLGGTLSFWLASHSPSLWGGMIAVDGVPYLPALLNPAASPVFMAAYGESIKKQFSSMNLNDYKKSEATALSSMITDPANIKLVEPEVDASDPASVGEAASEMVSNDLRPEVSKITCPVLLIMAAGTYPAGEMLKNAEQRYKNQILSIAHSALAVAEHSKHYIMFDDPKFFFSQVDGFLLKNKPTSSS